MATIPVYNPVAPFIGLIPGGLRPGLMVRLKGVMREGNRFMINLQAGCVTTPRDDVALHLSVRPTEHCIVRNHMTSHIWGSEERFGGIPIHPGQVFDILILTEATAYKIAINNVHFCMFQYRMPYHRVKFINVEGDVSIHSITLEGDIYQQLRPTAPVALVYPSLASHPVATSIQKPHWSVGAVPVLPPHPPPPPSPYPHGVHKSSTTEGAVAYQSVPQKNKSKSKALKAAAIVGGVGLGAFAVSQALSSNRSDFGVGQDGNTDNVE